MGTSQSLSLKTTPNWASAKRAMSTIVRQRNAVTQQQVNSLLRNVSKAIIHDSNRSYGRSGGRIAKNFTQFISFVRSNGIEAFVEQVSPGMDFADLSVKDVFLLIKKEISNPNPDEDHSTLDDLAARIAFEKLVAVIFSEIETVPDLEDLLRNATENQLDAWMVEFQVEYIMELNGILFDAQIFSKGAEPDQIASQIRDFVRVKINEVYIVERHQLNLLTPEGEQFVESLTLQILGIWAQE